MKRRNRTGIVYVELQSTHLAGRAKNRNKGSKEDG
jgi:hypothetical protein